MKLRDLTSGERLLVDRRRRGESQRDAAARLGVTLYRYRSWERGRVQVTSLPRLQRLKEHERCFLLRYRSGLSSEFVAKEIGVSSWWLCQIEFGRQPVERLSDYWNGRQNRCETPTPGHAGD